MRTSGAGFSHVIFLAIGMSSARAGHAETFEGINQAAAKLDRVGVAVVLLNR